MAREDLARMLGTYITPLKDLGILGCARPTLGVWGADYDEKAAQMEAFVRPLWGIAPLLAGGEGEFDASAIVTGIDAGTDPSHPDYWGDVGAEDQRMVEMAGIAYAWLLAPDALWFPLSEDAKLRAAKWMSKINDHPTSDNNWLFFRVLVNLALRRVGAEWSEKKCLAALNRLDEFHLGEGYYRDGQRHQIDWYVPMAFHFYGLLVAAMAGDVFPVHAQRFRQRAREFAQSFQYWFSDNGAAIPFGRSMTYRMAQSAFWAACAFADEEVLPWKQIKGLLQRNLDWWPQQPMRHRDGVLTIGYAYPNPLMAEGYNALGSPYWALKPFLALALPTDHPFWQVEAEPPEAMPNGQIIVASGGFAIRRCRGQAEMLTGGQDGRQHRGADAKYGGFAYSSAFAFSVPSDASQPDRAHMSAIDSGMSVSRDGVAWIRRGRITDSGLRDGAVWGRWAPDPRLCIESWLAFAGDGWHIRVHQVKTDDPLEIAESGFAVDGSKIGAEHWTIDKGMGMISESNVRSGLLDMLGERKPDLIRAAPNTNLLHPRSVIPRLLGQLPAGTNWLCTAVCGSLSAEKVSARPEMPETLRRVLETAGITQGH